MERGGLDGPGPGNTDNVRVRAKFGPGSNDSNHTFWLARCGS
jgi:hypothetical protein